MRQFILLSIMIMLLLAIGCSRGVVVVKTQRPQPTKEVVIVQPDKADVVSSENHLRQAKKFYYGGKYKQAQKHCEKAIQFNHSNWEAHYYLGLSLQGRREFAQAVDILSVSLKYSPENNMVRSELHLAMGYSWEKLGQAKNAQTEYALALEYNPDNMEAQEARNRIKIDKTMNDWGKKKNMRP